MDFKVVDGYKLPQSTIDKIYESHPLLKPDQLEIAKVYMMVSTHNGKHMYGGPSHMFLCCGDFYTGKRHVVSLYNGMMFDIEEAERVGYAFRELNKSEKVEFN